MFRFFAGIVLVLIAAQASAGDGVAGSIETVIALLTASPGH